MKVLVGSFTTESNANIPTKNDIDAYDISFGEDLIEKMKIGDVFRGEGIEIIPSIYANAHSSGVIKEETFKYILSCFINPIKENLKDLDGIYLMLHGASEVENIGSGDHYILNEIRKVVGEYLPIAIACDPHGNLSEKYVSQTTILRSYRESPHTDAIDTWRNVARMLIDLLKNRRNIQPLYSKLPMILGGEQSVSADEPVKTINKYLDEIESDSRILSCSWHVGYLRHDTDVAGCGVVVIPNSESDKEYAQQKLDELHKFVWDKRHEFHYTGLTKTPEEALKMAVEHDGELAIITDSGDNVTSGASGWNTFILNQVLEHENLNNKNFLFAAINDSESYHKLKNIEAGESLRINLGKDHDELSKSIDMEVEIIGHGTITAMKIFGESGIFGKCVTIRLIDKPITIIVTENNRPFVEIHQFESAGVNIKDYNVVIVKQGYIFPELKEISTFNVMSLTDGATPQNTAKIPFKRIMRPMFPIDDI